MGVNATDLDRLPPESRFAVRAAAAGLGFDEAAEILRIDGPTLRKHVRTAVRETGGDAPPPSSGDDALRAALEPARRAAAERPSRRPSTPCPSAEIASDLAHGRLDGPLVLATAEHAADCPSCMTALVAARRAGPPTAPPPGAPAAPGARGIDLPLVLGAAAGLAAAAWYLWMP